MELSAPCCNTGCLPCWQSCPPRRGFTLLPCQGFSIQRSKRKSCIWRLDFKSLFLTAWCSCVLQARLTDIGPRGGSALKNLPWEIFAPLTPFSAFLLTPRTGNFPQQKKQSKWGVWGEMEEKNMLQWVGSWAGMVHARLFPNEAGGGTMDFANTTARSRLHPSSVVGQLQIRGTDLLWARQEERAQHLGARRGVTWTGKRSFLQGLQPLVQLNPCGSPTLPQQSFAVCQQRKQSKARSTRSPSLLLGNPPPLAHGHSAQPLLYARTRPASPSEPSSHQPGRTAPGHAIPETLRTLYIRTQSIQIIFTLKLEVLFRMCFSISAPNSDLCST